MNDFLNCVFNVTFFELHVNLIKLYNLSFAAFVQCLKDTFLLKSTAIFNSFSLLCSVPSNEYTTTSLFIFLLSVS